MSRGTSSFLKKRNLLSLIYVEQHLLEGQGGVSWERNKIFRRDQINLKTLPVWQGWVEACGCVAATFYRVEAATLSQLWGPGWCTSDTGCQRLHGASSSSGCCRRTETGQSRDNPDQSVCPLSFYNYQESRMQPPSANKQKQVHIDHVTEDSCSQGVLLEGLGRCLLGARPSGWRSERCCRNSGGFVPAPKKKWEQLTKEQRGLARHLAISYGMFPPLRLLSLADSHGAPARYQLLHPTNEAASLLLKTITIRTMTLSFFLLPTLFHPHGRWTEVKAKPCSFTTSLLQYCSSVDVLMNLWNGACICVYVCV